MKVSCINLGCRVNRAELDAIERSLIASSHTLLPLKEAEIAIVNTCCVTREAQAKSRKKFHALLKNQDMKRIYVTGCALKLHKRDFESEDPRVKLIEDKDMIVQDLNAFSSQPHSSGSRQEVNVAPFSAYARPNILIQQGCNKSCTYCCVWQARGRAHSISPKQVCDLVCEAYESGSSEVVLCGIDVGAYNYEHAHLADLLDMLLSKTSINRIRLSSIEPTSISQELLTVIANSSSRIAPFLHIPLQSGSDAVLQAMARPYTKHDFLSIVDAIYTAIPECGLSTDCIVGFPQESSADFVATLDTVYAAQFMNVHVFKYSARPHTKAAEMPGHVSSCVKDERSSELISVAHELREDFIKGQIGKLQSVAVEKPHRGVTQHLLTAELPTAHRLHNKLYEGKAIASANRADLAIA